PLHPPDDRVERVADQDPEHDRDDHRGRDLQHHHDREPGQDRERGAADVDRHRDDGGTVLFVMLVRFLRQRLQPHETIGAHGASSSCSSALLIATAALTPSAAATMANCASRDASPATNTPGTLVSLSVPVMTVPCE